MTPAEQKNQRRRRRDFLRDLVLLVRSGRAAIRRCEAALAVQLLAAAAFELGVARERYGASASTEWLRRALLRLEHVVAVAFDREPSDIETQVTLALFRANLGERRGPKRAPLRLVAEKAEAAS